MNYTVTAYVLYLLITTYVVVVVGHLLHKNGRPFLINVFHGNISLAESVNNILLAGYYLVNIGYCVAALRIWAKIDLVRVLIEVLSVKIGTIVLVLGIMHLFNILTLLVAERKYRNTNTNTNKS